MKRMIVMLPLVASLAACSAPQRTLHTASYPSGQPRWQTEMRHGVPDGPSVTWHPNGQLASRGEFREGRKVGIFRYWDDAGQLIRVEEFRDGRLVSESAADPRPELAPPGLTRRARAPEAPSSDEYTEFRFGLGAGGSTAAREVGETETDPTLSMSFAVLRRNDWRLLGFSSQFSGSLFGPSHAYLGGLFGYASPGRQAHVELLAEGGIHSVSDLGDDLFARSVGDDSAVLPYAGLQSRLILDPGEPHALVVEIAAAARFDLARAERMVTSESCFFGCTTSREAWELGGTAAEVTAGLSYQFD